MDAKELMKPDKPKNTTESSIKYVKRETMMTKQLVSKPVEIPVAPLAPIGFDCQGMVEELLEDILEGVAMIAESAQQFEEAKKHAEESHPEGSRRKVIRNNMDYLLTVIEERHRNADSVIGAAAGGLDIRYSVKDCYRKFFTEDPFLNGPNQSPAK